MRKPQQKWWAEYEIRMGGVILSSCSFVIAMRRAFLPKELLPLPEWTQAKMDLNITSRKKPSPGRPVWTWLRSTNSQWSHQYVYQNQGGCWSHWTLWSFVTKQQLTDTRPMVSSVLDHLLLSLCSLSYGSHILLLWERAVNSCFGGTHFSAIPSCTKENGNLAITCFIKWKWKHQRHYQVV